MGFQPPRNVPPWTSMGMSLKIPKVGVVFRRKKQKESKVGNVFNSQSVTTVASVPKDLGAPTPNHLLKGLMLFCSFIFLPSLVNIHIHPPTPDVSQIPQPPQTLPHPFHRIRLPESFAPLSHEFSLHTVCNQLLHVNKCSGNAPSVHNRLTTS